MNLNQYGWTTSNVTLTNNVFPCVNDVLRKSSMTVSIVKTSLSNVVSQSMSCNIYHDSHMHSYRFKHLAQEERGITLAAQPVELVSRN